MKKGLKKFGNALTSSQFWAALALACVLGFVNPLQAQDDTEGSEEDVEASDDSGEKKPSKILLGIRSGMTFGEFQFAGEYDRTNFKRGFTAGAFFTYNITRWVGVSLEAAYNIQGAKNLYAYDGNTRHSFAFHGVQGNLLGYFKLPVLSVYEPRFIIGPSFNYNVHTNALTERPTGRTDIKTYYDGTSLFTNMDLGMIVGLGVDFDLKFAKLLLDARYRAGFSDLNTTNEARNGAFHKYSQTHPGTTLGNSSVKTSAWSFNVGLGFAL